MIKQQFIRVTCNGSPIYIREDQVLEIYESNRGVAAIVTSACIGDEPFEVDQSVEEVADLFRSREVGE